jgi:microcystin-dependent protein
MAEDHFNAVGSGTVTEKNAHGLEFEDMGHSFIDVDLITHRKRHHSNGVITDNEADSSRGLTPSTSSLTPIGGDAAAVFLRKFNAVFGEHAIVNGGHYTDVLPKLVAPLGSYVVGDAYVSFPSGGAGTYAIVLKIVGSDLTVERRIAPYTIDTFADLIIAEVVWNGSAFTGITDLRVFGSIGSKDMQALSVGTSELKDDAVISRNIDIADGSSASDPNSGSGIASDHIKIDAVLSKHVADADGTSASVSSSGSGIATPHLRDLVATSQKIALADGTSGQVTTTGSGIKTGHIQDEAITLQKLAVALQGLLSTGIAPTGSITAFGGGTAPTGWYECNGQPVSRVGVGAALFAAVGTRWGSGDGVNTFNVPDLRGVVLRGLNGTSADAWSDPDVLTRVARPIAGNIIGTAVGNNVGSFQTDEFKSHHHDTTIASAPVSNGIQGGSGTALTNPPTITGDTGGNETRMKNAAVMYIIKS